MVSSPLMLFKVDVYKMLMSAIGLRILTSRDVFKNNLWGGHKLFCSFRVGPEEAGPRGMSPSSTFRPGKVGLLAKGWSVRRVSRGKGVREIQSLV